MAAGPSSDPQPPEDGPHPAYRNRPPAAQSTRTPRRTTTRSANEDAGFWACLEERELGRLALEADHLFDTSYPWAA